MHLEIGRYGGSLSAVRADDLGAVPLKALMARNPQVDWSAIDSRALLAGAGMGLIFNPTGRMLYSSAPRFAPASEVAVFAPVETVAATVWVWVAFGEQPALTTVLGGVIVISSVMLATIRR